MYDFGVTISALMCRSVSDVSDEVLPDVGSQPANVKKKNRPLFLSVLWGISLQINVIYCYLCKQIQLYFSNC